MNSRFKFLVVTSSACLMIALLVGAVKGRSAPPEDAYKHLAVYTEVLSRIKSDYVEEPDMKSVTLGALNGLLESIDPYASYLNADQYKQYLKYKDAPKAGVGLVLSKKFGYLNVVDAIPGSPAAKAGLATGDVLEAIGAVTTRDMPLAYAEMLLHGDPGTSVELTVLRVRRGTEPQKIGLVRAPIVLPPVSYKMLPDSIGRISLSSTEPGKAREVAQAITELQKQGAKKLILDLRDAPTGSPEEGIAIANLFLESGLICYLQGQKTGRQDFEAKPGKAIWKGPLVVITNRGTANGAEILAAALLDSKRADVVGERSYGDAAVRKAILMDDGSAVILSVAKYYSPSGKAIQDTGVTPNHPVSENELPGDELESQEPPSTPQSPARPDGSKTADDPLLKKAIEVLNSGKQVAQVFSHGLQR
ncbi:MAG: S41 family peptidase [Bryobacteraceae bacterium]|nr:S41 family peptidase [Bryobacteraceae bacterium]MDW8377238.1 S41 family peptidase [Bryobacterales bacterium]